MKTNDKEVNYSQSFENITDNELINRSYDVYIGKISKGKIYFLATKNKDIKYIQVCYDLSNEETRNREFGALMIIILDMLFQKILKIVLRMELNI